MGVRGGGDREDVQKGRENIFISFNFTTVNTATGAILVGLYIMIYPRSVLISGLGEGGGGGGGGGGGRGVCRGQGGIFLFLLI